MGGAFSAGWMPQAQCDLVHIAVAQLRVTLMVGTECNSIN
jgi:hypothetical protein